MAGAAKGRAAAVAARQRIARGDFQTPPGLAQEICRRLRDAGLSPASVIEPTCGVGNFLGAAVEAFPSLHRIVASDLDVGYVEQARAALAAAPHSAACDWRVEDCFHADWPARIAALPRPWLLLGNPPWVTTSRLAVVGGANGPERRNVDRVRGIAALTGGGNFDISEALVRLALRLVGQGGEAVGGALALLCKATVARKALAAGWRDEWPGLAAAECTFHRIDARRWFGASVSAGLLVVRTDRAGALPRSCREFATLDASVDGAAALRTFGWRDGELLAEVASAAATAAITIDGCAGTPRRVATSAEPEAATVRGSTDSSSRDASARWRSGIKHDAAAVFELRRDGDRWRNDLGERVELEAELVFPLLKATDLHHGRPPSRWLLVPQRTPGEDPTARLAAAPSTRAYLARHASLLAARKSRLWRTRASALLFGLGPYAFTDWKLAVSAFHLPPRLRVVGPFEGRPVVVDDTVCVLPCTHEAAAYATAAALASPAARTALAARVFADRKRPLTVGVLDRALRASADLAGR